jgi:CheY-like chemotaxis protein
VLVVEDDDDIRDSLIDFLEDHGYTATGAVDGSDALARLRAEPRPAIVILDLMMPNMDGRAFLEEHQRDPALARIPVVVVSAYRDMPPAIDAFAIAGHLRKPLDLGALLAALEKHRLPDA